MQEEWDLVVNSAYQASKTTVHIALSQMSFFATLRKKATMTVNWVYPKPKGELN